MKSTNQILRDLRTDHDLTQADVAEVLGMPQQSYSLYERGRMELHVSDLPKLSKLYGVSVYYLLGMTDFRYDLDQLNSPYVQDLTVGAFLSDLLALDGPDRKAAVDYVSLLKLKQGLSKP